MHDEHGFHDGEREEHEHHHGFFNFGFFPFAYYPYFYSYLYPFNYPYYGYPYDYSYYGYPYDYYSYYDYPYYSSYPAYSYYPDSGSYSVETPYEGQTPSPPEAGTTTGEQYYQNALSAFHQGDYQTAARMGAHALIDMPREAKVHELMSLAMFALADYRGAAMEAHAALVLGSAADWPTLYAYYGNLQTYTNQLDSLRKHIEANPTEMDARFVLAYHDVMMGHAEAAESLLAEVTAKVPQDKVAAELLKQLQSHTGTVGNIATDTPPAK